MLRSRFSPLSLALLTALAATGAQAATILQYATANVTSLAPFSADPAVSATNLVAGNGINLNTGSTFNFRDWDPANASFEDAVADNERWTWGFTVSDTLASIDLTTMDIRLDRSSTGPDDFEIRVARNADPAISVLSYSFGDTDLGVNFLNVDLSALPELVVGDTLTFTLAAFNAEGTAGTFDLETITFPGGSDGIIVRGDVTIVPEPSTALLLGVGLVGIALRRRG